jgi:cytochrome c peroxidase
VLAYRVEPGLALGEHFRVDFRLCAKGSAALPHDVTVNAWMPEHRHGMNYRPTVRSLGEGRYRAQGLLFHMPGRWEFVFEAGAERLTHSVRLEEFSQDEIRAILRHGPWPPPWRADASNRVSGGARAIELGEKLFFEPRLSGDGGMLCATCHVPYRGWQDGRARALGRGELDRNTPSLLNVRWNRWFGWDGAGDSLWAQSVRPILDPREMRASVAHAARLVREDPEYACRYERAFGAPPGTDDEALLAGIGKALAAFQETLVSGRTPFDEFRDALGQGEMRRDYPLPARRGLKIFVGRGNCSVCHAGPAFTNGEFHDAGVAFFLPGGRVDPGRHGGIQRLRQSAFNLLGRHSDDATGASAVKTKHVALEHRNFGEFKVPSLRNAALTAPYMHNGSLATLADVVKHYSELDLERLHADGEAILRPLRLTPEESADLVAFLESLSERPARAPARAPLAPCGSRRPTPG